MDTQEKENTWKESTPKESIQKENLHQKQTQKTRPTIHMTRDTRGYFQ